MANFITAGRKTGQGYIKLGKKKNPCTKSILKQIKFIFANIDIHMRNDQKENTEKNTVIYVSKICTKDATCQCEHMNCNQGFKLQRRSSCQSGLGQVGTTTHAKPCRS